MKHGSLFSGIGGFDLAAEWMGWENVFHCEIDEFPRKILNYYWPNSISYEDIKTTDFTIHRGQIEILTGGFPCQPYSTAGRRLGKEDDRHLWPYMLEAIRSIQPRWVVGENVRGLVNWSNGLVFEEVQVDLETEGYEVQSFILPAAGVGAPHRRDRIWFIAYSNKCNDGRVTRKDESESAEEWLSKRNEIRQSTESSEVFRTSSKTSNDSNRLQSKGRLGVDRQLLEGSERKEKTNGLNKHIEDASDSNSSMRERRSERGQAQGRIKPIDEQLRRHDELFKSDFSQFPTQPSLCGGDDGLPTELDGITFPKWRNGSIKGYGNAVVPALVYEIFKTIEEYESLQ